MSSDNSDQRDLRPLFARSVLNSFGGGMVAPFLGAYAVVLGASPSLLGWLQSAVNIFPSILQVPWGQLSDRMGRRVPLILLGGIAGGLLWIPLAAVSDPTQLVVFVAVQSLLGSAALPAFAALIGDLIAPSVRGSLTGSINLWTSLGSLLATILSGAIATWLGASVTDVFYIPIAIAAVSWILSSLVLLQIKEKARTRRRTGILSGLIGTWRLARSASHYSRFLRTSALFGLFLSIPWALFSITLVRVLDASFFEIGLLSVANAGTTIIFQRWSGRLVDRVGRVGPIQIFRLSLFVVPLTYAFAPSVHYLILLNVLLGFLLSFGNIAMTSYLLDISPEEEMASFTALFNTVMGIAFFIGSLSGGYLTDLLTPILGLQTALTAVYLLSAIGRGTTALGFLTLRDPYTYPTTIKELIRRYLT